MKIELATFKELELVLYLKCKKIHLKEGKKIKFYGFNQAPINQNGRI